ncbi:hypothetical protein [Roseateles koreensis]|uniref:Uncharacterized protein n=1 Tax=Roseateles koreensis TaxID=2987526 RepID=A0ABT5KQY2_9BURK|nr:hypothetical protein [Roseateles koreensis]MDC8785321.1 hypothetical protein [Roseateles koreensis]
MFNKVAIAARNAKPQPLTVASPAGLNAPDLQAEHLLDFDLQYTQTPQTASLWAYNYRDQGRQLRSSIDAPSARSATSATGDPSRADRLQRGGHPDTTQPKFRSFLTKNATRIGRLPLANIPTRPHEKSNQGSRGGGQ